MQVTTRGEESVMSEPPDWLIPPPAGFFARDLDDLPDLPAHTELIDGALVVAGPQNAFHSVIVDVLVSGCRRTLPPGLRVRRQMSVILGPRQRPEPDVIVLRAEALAGPDVTAYRACDVVLVVEAVSLNSLIRDRERKPQLYVQAGIPHFWRVEDDQGCPTVYVYELDPATHAYALTGIHRDEVRLRVPFEIDIDLSEIDRL
jgi:Uma2 family endonuclease